QMGDTIGKYGLEKYWEERLRGENGGQQVEVDAFGRKLRVLDEVPEMPGANIHLTLDLGLQQAAEEAMGDQEGSIVVMNPNDGSMHFGNHEFHCWKKGGHGWVNLHEAIVGSCDVYFYTVGQRLGVDKIAEYAHRYGLGNPTGIPLDHERAGTIPDTRWKQQRY